MFYKKKKMKKILLKILIINFIKNHFLTLKQTFDVIHQKLICLHLKIDGMKKIVVQNVIKWKLQCVLFHRKYRVFSCWL